MVVSLSIISLPKNIPSISLLAEKAWQVLHLVGFHCQKNHQEYCLWYIEPHWRFSCTTLIFQQFGICDQNLPQYFSHLLFHLGIHMNNVPCSFLYLNSINCKLQIMTTTECRPIFWIVNYSIFRWFDFQLQRSVTRISKAVRCLYF